MPTYHVEWEIEVDAENPVEAAKRALEIQRNPESTATVFKIADVEKGWIQIDLLEIYEEDEALPRDESRTI